MIKNASNNFIIIAVAVISISITFSLVTITSIETTYANHTKYHLNNSLVDITISGDNIPDTLLEDIKKDIMKAEQKNTSENNNYNNNSRLQLETIKVTTKAKIILTGQNYIENEDSNYDDIIGQVKNIGNGTAESIKTIFTFYNNNGNLVGTDSTYTDIEKLNPGQKSPFSNMIDKREIVNGAYYEISLSWDNPDGTEEYIEDVKVTQDHQQKFPVIETNKQNNKNENFPFFKTNDNDIGKLQDEEDEEDEDDDEEYEDIGDDVSEGAKDLAKSIKEGLRDLEN
jgi:hypothetical protein